jgi:hypothetical protein
MSLKGIGKNWMRCPELVEGPFPDNCSGDTWSLES